MVYKSGQIFLPFCHNSRVWRTDGRTDGQTDRRTEISSQYRVCITCSAVKTIQRLKCWDSYLSDGTCGNWTMLVQVTDHHLNDQAMGSRHMIESLPALFCLPTLSASHERPHSMGADVTDTVRPPSHTFGWCRPSVFLYAMTGRVSYRAQTHPCMLVVGKSDRAR